MTKNDLEIQLEALQSLVRHPGWQIVVQQARRNIEASLAKMRNAKDSDELLKHTYTYMAVHDLLEVPDLLMKPLILQLQVLTKTEKKQ